MDNEYEKISIKFTGKLNKPRTFTALFFKNRQIATICDTFDNPDTGKIETEITQPGMTREEILQYFSKKNGTCNIEFLIRSILYEAYVKEGLEGTMESGNVRHFWYTHLKEILVGKMGKDEDKIQSQINRVWDYAILSGAVTYEEMNIYSEKESSRLSVVKDSPFSNIIIAVEKMSFFNSFNWMPRLFNSTLITGGGQPSRAVARRFILELKNLGVDLNQKFHMCVASDLDPSGYYIQESFKYQFEKAIEYYGGTGEVIIHRLFVRKDQVTPDLLKAQGIPWQPDTDKKSRDTIWNRFCKKTDGGLYIPVPSKWKGDVFEIDGQPMVVRALLEMDAFSTPIIEKSIVNELLKIIRDTNDESKIMIPEIMRIFNELKHDVSEELFEKWERILINPLKKIFLKDTDEWKKFIDKKESEDRIEVDDRYDELVEEKEDEKKERVPELFDNKEILEEVIKSLKSERDKKINEIEKEYAEQLSGSEYELEDVDNEIDEECSDIDEEIDELNTERDEELETVNKQYNFRLEKYEKFKEEHLTVFNPLEQSLKSDIDAELTEMDYRFKDLENRDDTKKEIGSLCVSKQFLIVENISCFDQPSPTFRGEKLLEKATINKDLNISKVRDGFTPTFIDSMKKVWDDDTSDIVFELSETFEMKDLTQEIKDAMKETENELEDDDE